jgi:hypothetical protein
MSHFISAGALRKIVDENKRDVSEEFYKLVIKTIVDGLQIAASNLQCSTIVIFNEKTYLERRTFDIRAFHYVFQTVFDELREAGYHVESHWTENGDCEFSIDWSQAEHPPEELPRPKVSIEGIIKDLESLIDGQPYEDLGSILTPAVKILKEVPNLVAQVTAVLDQVEGEGRDTGMGDAFSNLRDVLEDLSNASTS